MIYMVLEEFPSIGYIPDFGTAMSNLRSYNVGVMLCVQNVADIRSFYSTKKDPEEWLRILENCMVQLSFGAMTDLGPAALTNSKYFSYMSGNCRVMESMTSVERNRYLSEGLQKILSPVQRKTIRYETRPLLDEVEIRQKDGDEVFVFSFSHNAFKCKGFAHTEHPLYNIRIKDKATRTEELEMKASDHVPRYISGRETLFDESKYVLCDEWLEKSVYLNKTAKEHSISYSELRKKKPKPAEK